MTTLYGIKNCDTVKKARKWLDNNAIDYQFHDFREDGLSQPAVEQWLAELGWETLINKRSTTWKALEPDQRDGMNDATAVAAIMQNPTLIKRPLLDTGGQRYCGFKAPLYQDIFAN